MRGCGPPCLHWYQSMSLERRAQGEPYSRCPKLMHHAVVIRVRTRRGVAPGPGRPETFGGTRRARTGPSEVLRARDALSATHGECGRREQRREGEPPWWLRRRGYICSLFRITPMDRFASELDKSIVIWKNKGRGERGTLKCVLHVASAKTKWSPAAGRLRWLSMCHASTRDSVRERRQTQAEKRHQTSARREKGGKREAGGAGASVVRVC